MLPTTTAATKFSDPPRIPVNSLPPSQSHPLGQYLDSGRPCCFRPIKLCLARFTPPGPGGYHHRLECVLNNNPGSTQEVDLFGQGAWPAIEATCGGWDEAAAAAAWGGDDGSGSSSLATSNAQDERSVVYMRPTCVGIVSSGVVKVHTRVWRSHHCCLKHIRHGVQRSRFRAGQHTRATLVFVNTGMALLVCGNG